MNNQYKTANKGAIFARKKTGPKSPDMGGDLTIGEEVLQYILDAANNGEPEVKLDVIAYRNMSRAGVSYYRLSVMVPRPEEEYGGRQGGGFAQRGGFNQPRQAPRPQGQPQQRYGYPQSNPPQQRPQRQAPPQQQSFDEGYDDNGNEDFNDEIPFK